MSGNDREPPAGHNADAKTAIERGVRAPQAGQSRDIFGEFERDDAHYHGAGTVAPPRAAAGTPRKVIVANHAAPLPRVGDFVNQYEVIRSIGEGGMGIVYLARDTKLGRLVAIKFLLTTDPELTQRFILEARTTARCSHENIVVIYEVGEHGGRPYMVLEYLQGQTLTDLIEWGKQVPPPRAIELIIPVVRALALAHSEGIVHRDLKPDNIFVTDSGTIKVLDFGIAKVLLGDQAEGGGDSIPKVDLGEFVAGTDTDLTQRGTIMGTPQFMSPEQWGIGVSIDHRSDIWATGVMLYWMVTGRHPLAPLEGRALIETAMLHRPMPKVADNAYGVPPKLADLIDFCLVKAKNERLHTTSVLLEALEQMQPGRFQRTFAADESPYAGLSAFQEDDADRFFGRETETAALVQRLREEPLVGIVGPSGVGKSSLVRAGVVPALKQSGEEWLSIVIRPGREPLAALARILTPMIRTSTSVVQELEAQKRLERRLKSEPGYLGTVLRSQARQEKQKILLFVDQFEELYTLVDDIEERRAFTSCLAGVADDPTTPLRVVLSVRSDFLDRVPEHPEFMAQLSPGLVFVQAPNRDGLRDALLQPARMAGYRFESPAIIEDMLDTLQTTPGALPLLQFAAAKLWEMRNTAQKVLTYESYRSLGGIVGALASHADAFVAKLSPRQKKLLRTIFLRLVTPERTRAIVSVEEFREISEDPSEVQNLLSQLVTARLLVVHGGEGREGGDESMIEIVHESLIQKWPRLRKWLDETQEDAAFLDQLRTAAKQWQVRGYDQGLLWRGDALEEAKHWSRRYKGELPTLQERFLQHVLAYGARAERRKRNVVLATIVLLLGLVAIGAVALFVIVDSRAEAQTQAAAARQAETEAKTRLEEVQAKERERLAAKKETVAAKKEVGVANKVVEQTNEELKATNVELQVALAEAEESQERAKRAKKLAEENEAAAKEAKVAAQTAQKDAEQAQRRTARLLEKEKARAARLREQLGSAIIDDLK